MEVVIIGTGNVATVLSKLIVQKGHSISEIVGREYDKALLIAEPIGAKANNTISLINSNADLYIIAVSDDAIFDIAKQLQLGDKLVLHTAGSITKNALENSSINYGVLWPLQALRKEMDDTPVIPFVVDANNEAALNSEYSEPGIRATSIALTNTIIMALGALLQTISGILLDYSNTNFNRGYNWVKW